jgi:flavin-dependent dehydrogenase
VEGDAAGLVMKTSGEGISQALVSGEEIGWKIAHPE